VTNEIITTPFGDKVNYTGKLGKTGLPEGYGIGHYFELNSNRTYVYTGYGIDSYFKLNRTYVYTGLWFHGKNNGQGEAVWDDGDIYNGTWKDGFMNCQGTYKWSSGDVYEGILKHFV
jgi:hypothetical protein